MEKEVKNVKERFTKAVKNLKIEEKKKEGKEIKPLVSCRILFISVLDKIYMIALLLMLIGGTYTIFRGDLSSLHYGFWSRVGREIIFLIVFALVYLFMNWFYKCAAKTMLCVTENEIYAESYVPFKRSETSIPLNRITGISTLNIFWIFRCVIIHKYHSIPSVFWTWNNQEFKDTVNELVTKDKVKVENEFQDKNIITKERYKYVKYLGIALAGIIALIGVLRLFNYVFSPEKKVAGTYKYESKRIVLDKNGDCTIDDLIDNVTKCEWTYDKEDEEVYITYDYTYKSFYSSYDRTSSFRLDYNSSKKSLDYNGKAFTK